MSDIKVSEMPEATELNESDLLMIVQNGTNKKVKKDKLGISNINEKINNMGTYSTEEIDTGKKWINGKAIYRVVLSALEIKTGQSKSVDISSYNFERMLSMNAIGTLIDGAVIPIPYLYTSNSVTIYEENNNIRILSTGYNLSEIYITIEYTKKD